MPFPQVLTNKLERNLKIRAQWLDRKLGHMLIQYKVNVVLQIPKFQIYYHISGYII